MESTELVEIWWRDEGTHER